MSLEVLGNLSVNLVKRFVEITKFGTKKPIICRYSERGAHVFFLYLEVIFHE